MNKITEIMLSERIKARPKPGQRSSTPDQKRNGSSQQLSQERITANKRRIVEIFMRGTPAEKARLDLILRDRNVYPEVKGLIIKTREEIGIRNGSTDPNILNKLFDIAYGNPQSKIMTYGTDRFICMPEKNQEGSSGFVNGRSNGRVQAKPSLDTLDHRK